MGNLSYKLKPQADSVALDVAAPVVNSLTDLTSKARAGGEHWYPELASVSVGNVWGDHFDRDSITPTGYPTIWTTGGVGTETVAISTATSFIAHGLQLTTGAVIADDAFATAIGVKALRGLESISTIKMTIVVSLDSAADVECFLGIIDGAVTNTLVIPTTERHAGFILDRSVSANWRRSTGDGGTQSITSTSVAATTASQTLAITWTSGNVNFDVGTTDVGDNTANLPTEDRGYHPYLMAQTEAAAAKTARIDKIKLEYT